MEGLHGLRTPTSERAALKRAVQISSLVIETCEDLLLAKTATEDELLDAFDAQARELGKVLASAEQPLSMELKFFRDFIIRWEAEDTGVPLIAFTKLGLPVRHKLGEAPFIHGAMTRHWIRLYRDFHEQLQAASLNKMRRLRRRGSRGGRPKDPDVVQFEKEVTGVLASGFNHCLRNGADRRIAAETLKSWTPSDVVRRINDEFGRDYPLHGPEWDAIRKRVDRTPVYDGLKALDATWDESRVEMPVSSKRDDSWALENDLRIQR